MEYHVIQNLLINGFNCNEYSQEIDSPLFHLIVGDECEDFALRATELCLIYGGDPNIRSPDGFTPTHLCANWGRVNVFKLLLRYGGNPYIKDDSGLDCYAYALKDGHLDIIKTMFNFQVEEEYNSNSAINTSTNKMDLVNDWCDKYIGNNNLCGFSKKHYESSETEIDMNKSVMNHSNLEDDNKHTKKSFNAYSSVKNTHNDTPHVFNDVVSDQESTSDDSTKTVLKNEISSIHGSNEFLSCESNIARTKSTLSDEYKFLTNSENKIISCKKEINSYYAMSDNITEDSIDSDFDTSLLTSDKSIISSEEKKSIDMINNVRKLLKTTNNNIDISSNYDFSTTINSNNKFSKNNLNNIISGVEILDYNKEALSFKNSSKDEIIYSSTENCTCATNSTNSNSISSIHFKDETIPDIFKNVTLRQKFTTTKKESMVTRREDDDLNKVLKSLKFFAPPGFTINKSNDENDYNKRNPKVLNSCDESNLNSDDLNSFHKNESNFIQNKWLEELDSYNKSNLSIKEGLNMQKSGSVKSQELEVSDSFDENNLNMVDYGNNATRNKFDDKNSEFLHSENNYSQKGKSPYKRKRWFKPDETTPCSLLSIPISSTEKRKLKDPDTSTNDHDIDDWIHLNEEIQSSLPIHDDPIFSNDNSFHKKNLNEDVHDQNDAFSKIHKIEPIEDLTSDSFVAVAEEKKIMVDEIGVELIERRFLVTPCISENDETVSNASTDYSLPKSEDYDTDSLKKDLQSFGLNPGPITRTTKKVYIKRLFKLKRKGPGCVRVTSKKAYSCELEKTMKSMNWIKDLSKLIALDDAISKQFSNVDPNKKWRGGVQKASFTYLLLDPRITNNLPARLSRMSLDKISTASEAWPTFIESIFYIGKGIRSRPYAHLYQAVELWNKGTCNDKIDKDNKKVRRIVEIWESGQGVVCLNVFQHVIPVEAFTREAAMIDAMTLKSLTNIKSGEYYGVASSWPCKEKRNLGVYLLYRAMNIFLHEGERQIHPSDIK